MNIRSILGSAGWMALSLLWLPNYSFAHEETQKAELGHTVTFYFWIVSICIFVISFIIWTRLKNQNKPKVQWLLAISLLIVLSGGLVYGYEKVDQSDDTNHHAEDVPTEEVTLHHIHGLGFSSDGKRLLIPAHHGLIIHDEGVWRNGTAEKHDYMGFVMVDDGFYSSGHPVEGSDLDNPLGLVKSTDEGQTLEILDLHNEVDFHTMSAGYYNHNIYVYNPYTNSKMREPGLHYTSDEGLNWNSIEASWMDSEAVTLAVHPTNPEMFAVSSRREAYISADYGESFERLLQMPATALHYGFEEQLYIATYPGEAKLYRLDLENPELQELEIPNIGEDPIFYIAQNPQQPKVLALSTRDKDVYISNEDGKGRKWTKIAENGETIHLPNP